MVKTEDKEDRRVGYKYASPTGRHKFETDPLSSDNVRQQPPFRRGVSGGISDELKSENPRILGVLLLIAVPSRRANYRY